MEKELFLKELEKRAISFKESTINKNGVDMDCIILGDGYICPTVYLEAIDRLSINNIDSFLSGILNNKPDFSNLNDFFTKENILNNCMVCLAYDLSQDVASVDFLEMKVYLRLFINDNMSIAIKNEHLRHFDLSFNDVVENAKKNIKATCKDIIDVLLESGRIEPNMIDFFPRNMMLVIGNELKQYGAHAMFDTDLLDSICDIFSENECFVIPSSIHECIVTHINDDIDYMVNMIRTVNANEVSETEILSNNLFIYDRNSKSLRIAN